MKVTTKQALFGGALFAAGITAAAEAQWNVDQVYSFHQVFASDGTNSYGYGSGATVVNFAGPYLLGSATASVSSSLLYAEININLGPNTPYEFAQARAVAYLTVDAPKTVYASWDFTDIPPGGLSFSTISVYDITNGAYLIQYATSTSGTDVPVNLLPNTDYRAVIAADSDAPSQMFGQITKAVPAPGALALLGVAGLGVRRRRRICHN